MSTVALHIIDLVRSLPTEDQWAVRDALAHMDERPQQALEPLFRLDGQGRYHNPLGLTNDDPVFGIIQEIEAQRHLTNPRPLPEMD